MAKSFDEYKAEHTREPFPLPMPGGTTVPLRKGSIDEQRAVMERVGAAREAGTLTPFTGIEVLTGDAGAAEIASAWGGLPPEAWDAAMTDMRRHFGEGNSEASPPS